METMNSSKSPRTQNLCSCGKRMNKYADRCKACHQAKMTELKSVAGAIVATGKCPDCGETLRRNLSLTGWWQCAQFGAESHRKNPAKPSCNFQTFTE